MFGLQVLQNAVQTFVVFIGEVGSEDGTGNALGGDFAYLEQAGHVDIHVVLRLVLDNQETGIANIHGFLEVHQQAGLVVGTPFPVDIGQQDLFIAAAVTGGQFNGLGRSCFRHVLLDAGLDDLRNFRGKRAGGVHQQQQKG